MEVLIIRHGEAVDTAPELGDGGRWLTAKGRKVTREVARWLAGREEHRPAEIWTSPLVRAVQTAEIVAHAAEPSGPVSVLAALSTAGDPRQILRVLERYDGVGPLALVGHEPSLSALALELLGNVGWPGFKKSGVLGVRLGSHGRATFRFALTPKDLSVITDVARLKRSGE